MHTSYSQAHNLLIISPQFLVHMQGTLLSWDQLIKFIKMCITAKMI